MDNNTLVVINAGIATLSDEVEELLDNVKHQLDKAKEDDTAFRQALLDAMLKNDIKTAKVGKYTISTVVPHNTVVFDSKKFIDDYLDNTEFLQSYVSYHVNEKSFDLERFKKEHPDLYKEYTGFDEEFVVDTDKLQKELPYVFDKYSTEVVSTKKTTISIKEKKQ